jgi:hypothetical protein
MVGVLWWSAWFSQKVEGDDGKESARQDIEQMFNTVAGVKESMRGRV